MMEIACKPISIFLDFNAVIVNLGSLPADKQKSCLLHIEENVTNLKSYLQENILAKENVPEIPETRMAVLHQQLILALAIETWITGNSSLTGYKKPPSFYTKSTSQLND